MSIVVFPNRVTGQDIPTALGYLSVAGVTAESLTAGGVDITDPAALRAEVEELLTSALAEDILVDKRGAQALQNALLALYTDAEREECDRLAADMAEFLTRRHQTPEPREPRFGDECLNAE